MEGKQKVLLMPFIYGMSSRLLNMVKIADMLDDSGYDVTMFTSPATVPYIKTEKAHIHQVCFYIIF